MWPELNTLAIQQHAVKKIVCPYYSVLYSLSVIVVFDYLVLKFAFLTVVYWIFFCVHCPTHALLRQLLLTGFVLLPDCAF